MGVALRFLLDCADSIAAHGPGGCALGILHRACRLWALSWRFPRDFALGFLLSAANILLSSVPGLRRLHGVFLFHTRPQPEQQQGKLKRSDSSNLGEGGDEASMHRLIREFAPHLVTQ